MITDLLTNKKILIAVAHPDDVEFIMGGTLNFYKDEINKGNIIIKCVIFSLRKLNTNETYKETKKFQKSAFKVLELDSKIVPVENYKFRARFLPNHEDDIRLSLKKYKDSFDPDVIFTHYKNDTNQDHVSVHEQVLRVFPDKTVFGGEISNTGKFLRPNLFVGLKKKNIEIKANALRCYETENHKYYFSKEVILTQARFRGVQSIGCEFAEAFEIYNLYTGLDLT